MTDDNLCQCGLPLMDHRYRAQPEGGVVHFVPGEVWLDPDTGEVTRWRAMTDPNHTAVSPQDAAVGPARVGVALGDPGDVPGPQIGVQRFEPDPATPDADGSHTADEAGLCSAECECGHLISMHTAHDVGEFCAWDDCPCERDEHQALLASDWLAADRARQRAEALREFADDWQRGEWANAPRRADPIQERIANGQFVTDWLRDRADRTEREAER